MSDKIISRVIYCPRRVLAQTAKTRGGTQEVSAYRQVYFRRSRKNPIFVNTARKALPELCWGSDKLTAIK